MYNPAFKWLNAEPARDDEHGFDYETARILKRHAGGTRHTAYQDAAGSICLWVENNHQWGGCTISANAIKWLDELPGAHFIRLTNKRSELDEIIARWRVPFGRLHTGPHGDYFNIDLADLRGPIFSPVTASRDTQLAT